MKHIHKKLFFLLCIICSLLAGCANHPKTVHLSDVENSIAKLIETEYLKPCPSGKISVYSYAILNSEENSSFTDKLIVSAEILQQFYSPFLSGEDLELFHEETSTVSFILTVQNDQIIKEELPNHYYDHASSLIEGLNHFVEEETHSENYEKMASDCQNKARALIHSQIDADIKIQSLLDSIIASSLSSSSPHDMIQMCPEQWNQLLQFDYQLLDYCFKEFLKGSQTDAKGHLMMYACQSILDQWNDEDVQAQSFSTGQDWFDAYQTFAKQKYQNYLENNIAYFKRWHPGAWHCVEVSKSISQ